MIGDTLDELKARIVSAMDVTDFLDMLGLDLVDIIDLFDDELRDEEVQARFDRACR
jgi:hypothetical protein